MHWKENLDCVSLGGHGVEGWRMLKKLFRGSRQFLTLCCELTGPRFSSVQLLSRIRLFVTPRTAATPGLPVHHQLPELTQTHVHVHCGEGNGNPLQYSCLENPLVRGALWAAVHRVAQSWTPLKQPSMHWIGNGNPLQYSCLENPRDRGAWWAAIYGVAQSQTRLK